MIYLHEGIIKIQGKRSDIIHELAVLLLTIRDNKSLSEDLVRAEALAIQMVKEGKDVPHDISN